MENNDQYLQTMRTLYTALQAETLLRYEKAGVLNEIETEKYKLSLINGKNNVLFLNISTLEETFLVPSRVVECARWDIEKDEHKLTARCKGCKIINHCKKIGAPSPCKIYCLNPIEGMVKAINPDTDFQVKSTLWDSDICHVEVIK